MGGYNSSSSASAKRLKLPESSLTGSQSRSGGTSKDVQLPHAADLNGMKQELLRQKDWAKLKVVKPSAPTHHQPPPSVQGVKLQHNTAPRLHIPSISAGEWDNVPGTARFAAAVRDEFKMTVGDATPFDQSPWGGSTHDDNDAAVSSDSMLMDIDVHDLDIRPADGPEGGSEGDDILEVESQPGGRVDTVDSIQSNRGNASSLTHLANGMFASDTSVEHSLNKKTPTRSFAAGSSMVPLLSDMDQSQVERSVRHGAGVAEEDSTRPVIDLGTLVPSPEHPSPALNSCALETVRKEQTWQRPSRYPQDIGASAATQYQGKRHQSEYEADDGTDDSIVENKDDPGVYFHPGRVQVSETVAIDIRREHAFSPDQSEVGEALNSTLPGERGSRVTNDIEHEEVNVDAIHIAGPSDKSLEDLWKTFVFGKTDLERGSERIHDDMVTRDPTSSPQQDCSLLVHDSGSVQHGNDGLDSSMIEDDDQTRTSIDAASVRAGIISRIEGPMERSSPDPLSLDVSLDANHSLTQGLTSVASTVFHRPAPFKGGLVQHIGSGHSVSLKKPKRRSLRIAEHEHGSAVLEVPEDAIED